MSQSTGWWAPQACSASAEVAACPDSNARLCSLSHWSRHEESKEVIPRHSTVLNTRPVDRVDTQGPVITLSYVGCVGGSETHPCSRGVRYLFQPHTTLRKLLTRLKDCIPEKELSGVVYQVPCVGCLATYIGQTGRRLDHDQSLSEHRWAVESEQAATSALAEHAKRRVWLLFIQVLASEIW